jgi:hypothetical protein
MTTHDDILKRLEQQPMTADQVRKTLLAYMRLTDERLAAHMQFIEAQARICHRWGDALLSILAQRNVLTDEDFDAMAQEFAAGWAVDDALEEEEDQP